MTDDTKTKRKARLKEIELHREELALQKELLELQMLDITHTTKHISHGPSMDIGKGVFRLESGVYDEVLSLASVIERWCDQHEGEPVRLHIFSPGGSVFYGLALYDTLRTVSEKGHKVTTVIRGYAGSMASVIFLAGDVRLIGAESYIHQHEPSLYGVGGRATELSADAKFGERLYDKMARIYADRTGMTERAFKNRTKGKEWYAESSEALSLGIATALG